MWEAESVLVPKDNLYLYTTQPVHHHHLLFSSSHHHEQKAEKKASEGEKADI